MVLFRHIPFLRTVFFYTLTAFGGPQSHYGMMIKNFSQKNNYVTEEELTDYFSLCQLLPGPSSTQTITLIGYKRGGVPLALLTLLIWMLPACFFMGCFSFLITTDIDHLFNKKDIFHYLQPMTIGFLLYSSLRFYKTSVNNLVTGLIFFGSILATYLLFRTPWVFPILLFCGGFITNLSDKRIPERDVITRRQIKWRNIWLFIGIFAVAGILSETSRKNAWPERKAFNLFENFYRFGSIVFGGGDVLLPMMLDQYVVRPDAPRVKIKNPNALRMDKEQLLMGYGIVRAIPGPVFSVASYSGGIILKDGGLTRQALGCVIGSVAIFLPSTLLLFFFFPVWQNLKKYVVVYRALEGIYAVVTGFMFAGAIYLLTHAGFFTTPSINWPGATVVAATTLLLLFTKIPPPLLVFSTLLLGWIF